MPTKPRVSAHSSIGDKHLEGKYLFKYESTKEVAQRKGTYHQAQLPEFNLRDPVVKGGS